MLNTKRVFLEAEEYTPKVSSIKYIEANREQVLEQLKGKDNIGLELGVAAGIFSSRAVRSGKFSKYYGVDLYGDIHDTTQYIEALKYVGLDSLNFTLVRMDFKSALDLFPDNFFDFVYVDGFAHTGEDGGDTLREWYAKVKPGGLLAGDDYHRDWPLVIWAVNDLVSQVQTPLHILTKTETSEYCRYPTWFIRRPETEVMLRPDTRLQKLGRQERRRIHRKRMLVAKIQELRRLVRHILSRI